MMIGVEREKTNPLDEIHRAEMRMRHVVSSIHKGNVASNEFFETSTRRVQSRDDLLRGEHHSRHRGGGRLDPGRHAPRRENELSLGELDRVERATIRRHRRRLEPVGDDFGGEHDVQRMLGRTPFVGRGAAQGIVGPSGEFLLPRTAHGDDVMPHGSTLPIARRIVRLRSPKRACHVRSLALISRE